MIKHLLASIFACFIVVSGFAQVPTITSFTPTKAGAGATITITGTNFTNVTGVDFGVSARSYTVNSPTSITAVVNSSATSGNIHVYTSAGTATASGFVFELVPSVTNFTPVIATSGQTVTINGANLQDATAVTFGGTAATSFTATSSSISAVVANGSSGNVVVTTPGGTATAANFNYGVASKSPTISSFTPSSGTSQSTITIKGTNLNSVSGVSFGGTPATSFIINSETQITAVIGAGASGDITLISTKGNPSLAGFTFIPPPVVSGFSPNSITTTQSLTISGSNFSGVTGVSFGGVPATSFTVVSPTQINATAGNGTSGTVTLTANGQIFSAAGYLTVIANQNTPTINSYSTLFGTTNTAVTINGTNFTGATAVKFGGTDAASFSVISSTQINAVVGAGASGIITVATPNGTAALSGFTFQPPAPTITSFSPTSAAQGQTVTITGTNFNNVSAVNFGGILAKSFTVNSPTSITAVADSSASGAVTVTNAGGTATSNGFTYVKGPVVTSFTPTSAATGQNVVITGFNFTGTTAVYFTGVAASSFVVNSPTQITATVGNGATGGIAVNTPGGAGLAQGFTYISASNSPTITSFSPTTTTWGGQVVITGTNLSGVTSVNFGGLPARSFTVNSPTQITAVVNGGSSGTIDIASFTGTASAAGFTFSTATPIVTSFAPSSATTGDTVIITGTALSGVTSVYFGAAPAKYVKVNSATQVTAVVGNGASGAVQVGSPAGSSSLPGFTYTGTIMPPTITSFSPATASVGGMVTINGTNLSNVTAVSFGAGSAASFNAVSATKIVATVGSTSSTGSVTVANAGGYAAALGFTLDTTGISPIITSFSPLSARAGDTVVITGTGLSGATSVLFGSLPAGSFTVNSATKITAVLGNGTSGSITVNTAKGIYTKGSFTYLQGPYAPVITSFSPTTASAGATVIITGNNFSYVNGVSFGGTPAASYTVNSGTQITAVVGTGTSGNILLKTSDSDRDSTATIAGFVYGSAAGPATFTSFTPSLAATGDTVAIAGTNLAGVSAVSFGGVPAASFTIISPVQIKAVIGGGASGNVNLTTPSGSVFQPGFTFASPTSPVITSFSPASASAGTMVTINGRNLSGVTAVSFGGTPAASFAINSATQVTAIVGNGTSGNITLTLPAGTVTISGFTYTVTPAPTLTSFTPIIAKKGQTVTITGTNFSNASTVTFGGVNAKSFTVVSPTSITAVPDTGASGAVTVTTPGGSATRNGFTFDYPYPVPFITSFSPTSAGPGQSVTITGRNLSDTSGIKFGGVFARSYTFNSSTSITAVVDTGASGAVSVTTLGGTATLSGFTFISAPTLPVLTSFSPHVAATGDTVTIIGSNLNNVTAVSFGGIPAASFTIVSGTTLKAVVGAGTTGNIFVKNAVGSASLTGFAYNSNLTISSISPTAFEPGTTVTFTGTGFSAANGVILNGHSLKNFVILSATSIKAVIDSTEAIGTPQQLMVTTPGASATYNNFIYVPIVTVFYNTTTQNPNPLTFPQGGNVALQIHWHNIPNCTIQWQKDGIDIAGAVDTSYTATLAGNYTVKVSGGGLVTLSNPVTVTVIPAKPTITAANTLTAKQGDVVTLTGTNLTGISAVNFGGTAAASFTVNSATSISATVGAGSSGVILVTTGKDTAQLSGFNFVPVPTIAVSGATTILSTQTATLTASPSTGFSYQWMKDGVAINGATSATYTTNLGGQYTVVISLNGVIQLAPPVIITSIFDLPANTFTVQALSATCKGSANGFIIVKAASTGSYTATVSGGSLSNKAYTFTDSLQVTNLAAGTYTICMGVTGQPTYSKCFTVVVSEPKDLSVYVAAITPTNQVTLMLAGSASYYISLNGVAATTTQSQVTLQLSKGKNTILVNTGKDCQGVIEKDITIAQDVPYPNPFSNQISINLGEDVVRSAVITVTDIFGKAVYSAKYANAVGTVSLDLSNLKTGVYVFNLSADNVTNVFKIMKQ